MGNKRLGFAASNSWHVAHKTLFVKSQVSGGVGRVFAGTRTQLLAFRLALEASVCCQIVFCHQRCFSLTAKFSVCACVSGTRIAAIKV